jgi:DedD protein
MEKEKKKLLLVAVSVGVFLLVTITVAIIVLTPKTQETSFSTSVPYSNGRAQVTQWDDVTSQNTPSEPVIINSNGTDSNITEVDRKDGDNLTILIPSPSSAAVPETVQISETKRSNELPAAAPVKTTEPAPAVKPASQTSASKTTAAAKPAAAVKPAAPAIRTINDFWVQTGAFSAQIRAEDAKELLATKGITSIIENREINGKIWYRVRLGPYTSEREANHWLEIVKLIDGFNDSQIRQTVRTN